MSKRLLMLGAGIMQGVAIRNAKSRGWEVIVVDGNPRAPCASLADRFEPIDLKDSPALVRFALSLKEEGGLDGVFTAATDFSLSVAKIAEACGLPGHGVEAAANASDKLLMRRRFAERGVPSPAFIGIDRASADGAEGLLSDAGITFPLVVKPVDNMGARGCRKVSARGELGAALDEAIGYSRSGMAIIEEYMDGPEFSLEALVFDGEFHMTGFADRHIFFPPFFIEMGHTIPSGIDPRTMREIIDVFRRGAEALGLSHGAAKGDLKLTKRGPMVGEIAGRLSGGYMSGWTFPYSSGIDLTGAALDLAVGDRPTSLDPVKSLVCAERAWISIPGRVASVTGYESARSVPGVRDVFPRAEKGDRVVFPRNNVEKCGNCLAVAGNREEARFAAEEACRRVFIRLEANDPETDSFLRVGYRNESEQNGNPPSAFEIGRDVLDAGKTGFSEESIGTARLPVPSNLVDYLDTSKDWQGRTLREAIVAALTVEPALAIQLANKGSTVAMNCWRALLRGGIQGIVYAYDCQRT